MVRTSASSNRQPVTKMRISPLKTAAALTLILAAMTISPQAHPLGQFSINHYARLTMEKGRVAIRYVVDLAELPAFREAQIADLDSSGDLSGAEIEAMLTAAAPRYLGGLSLTADGESLPLKTASKQGAMLPGQTGSVAMGLATLRLVFDLEAPISWQSTPRRLHFENGNDPDKPGWREMVVIAGEGVHVFDSSIAGNGLTDELAAYPEEMLTSPLNERTGEWMATTGDLPAGTRPLTLRNGQPARVAPDRFLALISVPSLTPMTILIGLLVAFGLGAIHALSPGHGKTLVGAWLVGARGTTGQAAILGLTVTIAHTLTVYLGGLAFLLASRYVLPERLYPILSFISGAMIAVIGAGLLLRRIPWSTGITTHQHSHGEHSHLPADLAANGERISSRNLLALGISGGLIPCPSAWILMLGAISLNRTAYGLALILAFSLGLASVLTVIGITFVRGASLLRRLPQSAGIFVVLPLVSAIVIILIGCAIAWQSLRAAGIDPALLATVELESHATSSVIAILGLGLAIGLRHALDTDHLAAVSAIVCERKNLLSSVLIGGLWGVGHTVSLLVAGIGVILLQINLQRYEKGLEFLVALMLIGLGINALSPLIRHRRSTSFAAEAATHPDSEQASGQRSWSLRPLFVGMVHGLAGSAALMLSVLATIDSPAIAFAYIAIFGIGSIGGMMVMSILLGLPAHLTANSFTRANVAIRALSGIFSLGFGVWLVYEIGFVEGLLVK